MSQIHHLPNSYPAEFYMLKQVFLAHFEPMVNRFGPWKMPKCLDNGSFGDQNLMKNGSKKSCSKSDARPFGMLKQVFLVDSELLMMQFSPWKIPK